MTPKGILYSLVPLSCFLIFYLFYKSGDNGIKNTKNLATTALEKDEQKEIFQTCMNNYREVNKDDKFVEGRSIWIDEDGVKMICNLLHPSMRVLEYGSGGSTTMFSNFVSKWTSVEHDKKWGEKMKTIINNLNLQDKVTLHIVPNDLPYKEWQEDGTEEQFKTYVSYSRTLNEKFDLVIDDGRARVSVAKSVLENKILQDNTSILLIHDWERQYYKDIVDKLGYRILMEDTLSRRHLACLLPPESYQP